MISSVISRDVMLHKVRGACMHRAFILKCMVHIYDRINFWT